MAQPESSFKVCGLCSQLVDESVMLHANLRQFLEEWGLRDLPAKVCTDCYQGAVDSLKFKEKCLRAVEKLKKTQISVSMILGRSAGDMQSLKKSAKTKIKQAEPVETSTPLPKVSKKAEVRRNIGNAINESIESVFEPGPSSTTRRSGRKPPGIPQNAHQLDSILNDDKVMQPSVVLSNKDRETAENYINRSSSGRPLKRKSPYSPPKVVEASQTTPASTSRSKRSRAVVNYNPPEDLAAAAPVVAATPVGRRGSRKSSAATLAPPTAKINNQLSKKKGAGTVQYYVDNGEPSAADAEPEIIDLEDGEEEIFPSLGPYQCEICQQITETKQEFVAHIKSLHRDIVDESVLWSLESDLNKRKKKEAVGGGGLEAGKRNKNYESSKKKQKLAPPEAEPIKHKKKTPKKNKSFDEDDEYRPGGKKKHRKLSGDQQPSLKKSSLPKGPTNCSVCGTHLARESDLAKHLQTLKCRTAAYNIATTKAAQIADDANDTVVAADNGDKEVLTVGEGNSNSSVDAKFKANIAKRYEAERESGDTPPVDLFDAIAGHEEGGEKSKNQERDVELEEVCNGGTLHGDRDEYSGRDVAVDTEEYATDGDEDDTDAAIKAAMQESMTSGQDPSMSDSDSPAAYIDPTPQPDIKPNHPPPLDHENHDDYKSKSNTPDIPEVPDRRPSDSLERQMAALHGTPFRGSTSSPPFSLNTSMNYMF